MKQTFNIPDGCKTVSVEQIGNQLITSFEPEKYVPKKGDFVRVVSPLFGNNFIFECAGLNKDGEPLEAGDNIFNGVIEEKDDVGHCIDSTYTKLTPEQFKAEFDKLGCVYDFETHTAHKKRWRVVEDGEYYFINGSFEIQKIKERYAVRDESEKRFSIGNYHITLRKAEQYRDFMLKKSLEFHTNNK